MAPARRRDLLSTPPSSSKSSKSSTSVYDLSPLSRPPSNKWSNLQRETLVVLVEDFKFEWKIIKIIFNDIFDDEIPSPFGVSESGLRTYYWGLQRGVYKINGERHILRAYAIDLLQKRLSNETHFHNVANCPTELSDDEEVVFTPVEARRRARESILPFHGQLLTHANGVPDSHGHPTISAHVQRDIK